MRKGYFVKIMCSSEFNLAQIERHHPRIGTADTFNIATTLISFPAYSVSSIIMMTEKDAFPFRLFQVLQQGNCFLSFSTGLSTSATCSRQEKAKYRINSQNNIFHHKS